MAGIVDGTTSIGTERAKSLVGLDDDGRTSRGATSEVSRIDGVLDGLTAITVQTEGAHTHLIHVRLSDNNCASVSELLDGSRVNWGNEVCSVSEKLLLSRMVEAPDDCMPLLRMLSLTAIGIPSRRDLGMSLRLVNCRLTFLDALLSCLSFAHCLVLWSDVDERVEVSACVDVGVGGLDKLWGGELVGLHETRGLLDGFRAKDTFFH